MGWSWVGYGLAWLGSGIVWFGSVRFAPRSPVIRKERRRRAQVALVHVHTRPALYEEGGAGVGLERLARHVSPSDHLQLRHKVIEPNSGGVRG